MSALYDQVVELIKAVAAVTKLTGRKQEVSIHLTPLDYVALREELGFEPGQDLATPGTWLLDIQFLVTEDATPGIPALTSFRTREDVPPPRLK